MSLNLIKAIQQWKKTVLIISFIPIILLGVLYITYGKAYHHVFDESSPLLEFLKLSHQASLIASEKVVLPIIVRSLGFACINILNINFVLWGSSFCIVSYSRLSRQIANKIELILELVAISIVYFFIISPSAIAVFILGCIALLCILSIIIFYWIYEIELKK